jgi:hypothetical protein
MVNTILMVINLLAKGDYSVVYELDKRKILSATDIEIAIEEYFGVLTLPPKNIMKEIEIYKITGEDEVYIDIDLWYNNEQSDSALSITLINSEGDFYDFSIENIHML